MKSKNILRGFVIALIAIACVMILPNVVNADVTYTRTITGSNKSLEFVFNGLTLIEGKQYQFALTTSVGVTGETKWYNIANTTATSAVVNLNAAEKDIAKILKELDTGYIYIKAIDSTDGTYALEKKEVDLKLPMLEAISYSKAGNWYSINELYNTGATQGSGIGLGNATLSKGTHYQFQKVTDRNFIAKYLENKNDVTRLANLLPEYPKRGYAQRGYISSQDYNDGLYILWIEQVGTGTDKTVHGAIIHDGKPTATTVDEYLGTSPSPSPSASPSPSQAPDGTWADVSKMKVEVTQEDFATKIKINGISSVSGHFYGAFLSKNKISKSDVTNSNGSPKVDESVYILENNNGWVLDSNKVRQMLELAGDTYLYIYEYYYNQEASDVSYKGEFIVKDYVVPRPEVKLGSRIKCYFFGQGTGEGMDGYTSTFLYTPHSEETSRKIKLKIGKITDTNILRAIKNGETDCLSRLLDYAKKADKVYEATIPFGYKKDMITDKFDIVDKGYYYVWMVMDDENGTYYPVEDVSLYQGLVDETIGKNLFDYLSDEFKWNIGDDPAPTQKPDDTTIKGKLPQTGQTVGIILVVIVASVAGVIFYIKQKEYKL